MDLGARCSGEFGWAIALQAGRSQVRFPMVSLKFLIDSGPGFDSDCKRNGR